METNVNGEASPKNSLYVIQTVTGGEEILIKLIRTLVDPAVYTEAFLPKREMNRRIRGAWRIMEESLFPGYVFVYSENPDALFLSLRTVPKMSKLLHDDRYFFISLTEKEEAFINRIGQERGDHVFRLSKVKIESEAPYKPGDKVQILEGDLKNFAGEIVSYNLRKRKAIIRTRMFGGNVDIHVGIEIIGRADIQKTNKNVKEE